MLKLEKSSPQAPITITLRERESFLNSLLLKAFLIALLIHLGIVMLFRIQPFLIKAEFFHPPTRVQMDQPHSSRLTLLDEESADQIPLIPAPPLSIFINEYAFKIDSQLTSPVIDLELWNDSFAAPENRPISYKAPPLSIPLTYQPIQFFISGELAQRPLKKYDSRIDELLPYKIHSSEPVYVTYKVHIDSSGFVFWYEIERTTGNNQANALAEELLLSLEFAPSKLDSNSTGIIDFVISIF